MVPLPRGLVGAFEAWLSERWTARNWYVRRGALQCSFGLLGLRWSEVELIRPGDFCQVSLSLDVRTAKRGCRRRIDVPEGMVAAVLELRSEVKGGADRVFVRRNGRALGYTDQIRFTTSATKAVFGRRYTFHCFRHTAAVRVWERTHDVLAVQRFLGHRSLMWTNEYLRSLLVVDVGGAVAFCGGAVIGPRLFDPDDQLGRRAVVRGVASRGKASGALDEVALHGDQSVEAKAAVLGHVCSASELVPMRFGVGEQRWHCLVCGARWRKEESGEMVLEEKGSGRVELTRAGRVRSEVDEERELRLCPSVHAKTEERWGESGVEVWCVDCGKYLGRKVERPERKARRFSKRKGVRVDTQGRLW